MKVIITTSDNYHHCLPVFFKQYNKHWGDPFELVGYKQPKVMPLNCTFVSLGEQRGAKFFSDDLAPYFAKQPDYFVWMMEDSFIKSFDRIAFDKIVDTFTVCPFGRIGLTNEGMKRPHVISGDYYYPDDTAQYRLSTQPSIWERSFLLYYMRPGLSPWGFETQKKHLLDNYKIVGAVENIVIHNEGVRKHDIHNLNLEGIE